MAATFSSIGLIAIYLNPVDALHGDLGLVDENDVCILFSISGETAEIVELMQTGGAFFAPASAACVMV